FLVYFGCVSVQGQMMRYCVLSMALVFAVSYGYAQKTAKTETFLIEDVYSMEGVRDPFTEVKVSYGGKARMGKEELSALPADPSKFELIGIVSFKNGKQAMLAEPPTGRTFTLSGGKVYNQRQKPVEGLTGIIYGKEVTLFQDGKIVKALKLEGKKIKKQSVEGDL
ncbi:MAG: hypothetical protein NTW04_03560, partial [Elusimicrobia bacterium]|nr:hypothetical protein [Elusimicrobiota bacterium]